tara:strand:+ start:3563 stop:4174 length:612 start_codon:yes stop_codon:yes gene_type:complete
MNFKKDKYTVIRKAISKDLSLFVYNYFLMKRQVAKTLFETKFISPFEKMFGIWNDPQVPDTYSNYADVAGETLLLKLQPLMEKVTKMKLLPNYSYTRIYKKGDVLKRHTDRDSCEISTTLNLGGDPWPIYLEPSGKRNAKGVKIILKHGDMLVYRGIDLEHWREAFEGDNCGQVFLHYNNAANKDAKMFDRKIHLGLPNDFQR